MKFEPNYSRLERHFLTDRSKDHYQKLTIERHLRKDGALFKSYERVIKNEKLVADAKNFLIVHKINIHFLDDFLYLIAFYKQRIVMRGQFKVSVRNQRDENEEFAELVKEISDRSDLLKEKVSNLSKTEADTVLRQHTKLDIESITIKLARKDKPIKISGLTLINVVDQAIASFASEYLRNFKYKRGTNTTKYESVAIEQLKPVAKYLKYECSIQPKNIAVAIIDFSLLLGIDIKQSKKSIQNRLGKL